MCVCVHIPFFPPLSFFLILSREKIRTKKVSESHARERVKKIARRPPRPAGEKKRKERATADAMNGMKMKDYSFSGCFLFGLKRRMQCRRGLHRKWCRGGTRRFIEPETQQHAEQHTTFRGDCTISTL